MVKETADLQTYSDAASPPSRDPFRLAQPRSRRAGEKGAEALVGGDVDQHPVSQRAGVQDKRVADAVAWLQAAKERLGRITPATQAKPRADDVISAIADARAKPQPPDDNLRALFVRAMRQDQPDWSEADAQYAYGQALAEMQQRAQEKLSALNKRQQRKAAKQVLRQSLERPLRAATSTSKSTPSRTRLLASDLTPGQQSYFQQAVAGAVRDKSIQDMLLPHPAPAQDSPGLPVTEEREFFAKKEAGRANALEQLKLQRKQRDARAPDSALRSGAASSKRGGASSKRGGK